MLPTFTILIILIFNLRIHLSADASGYWCLYCPVWTYSEWTFLWFRHKTVCLLLM